MHSRKFASETLQNSHPPPRPIKRKKEKEKAGGWGRREKHLEGISSKTAALLSPVSNCLLVDPTYDFLFFFFFNQETKSVGFASSIHLHIPHSYTWQEWNDQVSLSFIINHRDSNVSFTALSFQNHHD